MLIPTPKNCDTSVKKAIQLLSSKLDYDAKPVFAGLSLASIGIGDQLTLSKTCTTAAGLNVLRVTGLQTDDTALTGTLRGAYIDVSNGSTEATGTIRALELKARTEAPGDTGSKVAVLEGLSISADSKAHDVTTMRVAEFILDGKTAGTIVEAVGLRIANNLQIDKATNSYGLQIYRDSFDYTYDISLSLGGYITGNSYVNQDLRTTASPTHTNLILSDWQLNTPTYNSVHDWMNTTQSAGRISGGVISDSEDGEIDVSAGTGIVKITSANNYGVTKFIDWSIDTDIALAAGTNYIYITYGAGTPAVAVTSTRSDIDGLTEFTIGRVYKEADNTLHIINSGTNVANHIRTNHQRLIDVRGFEHASGGAITETGQRYLISTDGLFYLGANPINTTAVDTSGAEVTFTAWHLLNGTWTPTSLSQIDNLNYNNVATPGSESLDNLTAASHYGVHWIYIHYDSDIHVIYGQGSYKLSEAVEASLPASLPAMVSDFGVLAGKAIVLKSANNLHSIKTAYQVFFPVTLPANHSDLGHLAFADSGHTGFQAQSNALDSIVALGAIADNEFIVGTGAGTYAHESGATARTSIGLGTGNSPTFTGLTLSGTLAVEGASVTVGKASTTTGTLVLHDSNSANTITLTVPDISAGSLSFTLPPTDGDNLDVLQTNGSGVLTWAAAAGGTTWIALTDTDPANYTGEAGNCVVVNAGEDGLEFGAAPGGAFTSYCRAYINSAQSITRVIFTKLLFDVENYDNNNEFASSRWTCKEAGHYHFDIFCGLILAGNEDIAILAIQLNATTWIASDKKFMDHEGSPAMGISGDYEFAVDDFLEMWVYHSNATTTTTDDTYGKPWFSIHRFA